MRLSAVAQSRVGTTRPTGGFFRDANVLKSDQGVQLHEHLTQNTVIVHSKSWRW